MSWNLNLTSCLRRILLYVDLLKYFIFQKASLRHSKLFLYKNILILPQEQTQINTNHLLYYASPTLTHIEINKYFVSKTFEKIEKFSIKFSIYCSYMNYIRNISFKDISCVLCVSSVVQFSLSLLSTSSSTFFHVIKILHHDMQIIKWTNFFRECICCWCDLKFWFLFFFVFWMLDELYL